MTNPEIQEYRLEPRKIFVTIDGTEYTVNRKFFNDWLHATGRLWYRGNSGDEFETSTGYYSLSQYWDDCPKRESNLVEYMIAHEKIKTNDRYSCIY
jgi:hypothetical protein